MKPPDACTWLQNKAYDCDIEPKRDRDEFRTPFWCLKTHDAIGPDGGGVDCDACGPERNCYRPEVEL